jgi:hypothetical protein
MTYHNPVTVTFQFITRVGYNLDSALLKLMVMGSNATQFCGAYRGEICRMRKQQTPSESVMWCTVVRGSSTY